MSKKFYCEALNSGDDNVDQEGNIKIKRNKIEFFIFADTAFFPAFKNADSYCRCSV